MFPTSTPRKKTLMKKRLLMYFSQRKETLFGIPFLVIYTATRVQNNVSLLWLMYMYFELE